MTQKYYNMSFTASSLRRHETIKIAELYLESRDWEITRNDVMDLNLLQQRTSSSSNRLWHELTSRLKHLSDDELVYLVNSDESQKRILLWIMVCRRYRFIEEFANEVIKEHQIHLNSRVEPGDFDVFLSSKMNIHDDLTQLSHHTIEKVRQVIFSILRDVGLLDQQNNLNALVADQMTVEMIGKGELDSVGIVVLDARGG